MESHFIAELLWNSQSAPKKCAGDKLSSHLFLVLFRTGTIISNVHYPIILERIYPDSQHITGESYNSFIITRMSAHLSYSLPGAIVIEYVCICSRGRIYNGRRYRPSPSRYLKNDPR